MELVKSSEAAGWLHCMRLGMSRGRLIIIMGNKTICGIVGGTSCLLFCQHGVASGDQYIVALVAMGELINSAKDGILRLG